MPLFLLGEKTFLSQSGTVDSDGFGSAGGGVEADFDSTGFGVDGGAFAAGEGAAGSDAFGNGFDSAGKGGAIPGGNTGIGSNFILFVSVDIRDSPRIHSFGMPRHVQKTRHIQNPLFPFRHSQLCTS